MIMINSILATKIGMTQVFVEGRRVPVTVVKAGPCVVTQIKGEKDGYSAVQIGLGRKKSKNVTKPLQGHLKKAGKDIFPRFIREIKLEEAGDMKVGDQIKVSDIFAEGDNLKVTGISKGKGFAGGVKRWHFRGGPKTHGQSDRHRAPGAIGQGTDPGRIWKGKRMAGRMGSDTKTIKGIKVISINPEKDELSISGPIPGSSGRLLVIKKEISN
jgi:large subunit ribosomal protein L3